MRVLEVRESRPCIPYRCPAPGGAVRERFLDQHEVFVDILPLSLDLLVVTADLQAREIEEPSRLLGQVVAEKLFLEHRKERIGVLLAGDFYSNETADKMGTSGEVGEVWRDFSEESEWVAGVLGNHDRLQKPIANTTLLDGDVVDLGGFRIAGVGGIIGKSGRLLRRDLKSYIETVESVLTQQPHILVLHESPEGNSPEYRGRAEIRELLLRSGPTLVICGHCHWPFPLVELVNGTQILNVDSRLCLLRQK